MQKKSEENIEGKERFYMVSKKDFPLCCPPKNNPVWKFHPRVYLTLDKKNQAICPYCEAKYVFKGY